MRFVSCLLAAGLLAAISSAQRADGVYADIKTNKGLIVARLEFELTPMTVANFVGLAEGTIDNAAFDPGRPFFDGTAWHRVEPGHVIQTGIPQSDRARGPGYMFPNEIHAKLSHNHLGAINMANGGPNTNASQWCIMLGDRSYLDGDYTVFGDVVEGLDVVKSIVKGDAIESVRIVRVGARAQAFHPTTASFQAMVKAAEERVKDQSEKKRVAEREWVAKNYPKATGPEGGVLSETLASSADGSTPGHLRYRGTEVRYVGDVIGRDGPPIQPVVFASGESGAPGYFDPPQVFAYEAGKTKVNAGFDQAVATMHAGDRKVVIVPASMAYGKAGLYKPEVPGQRRFVVSPYALLVYEVEALK
ncbi:MAG TPA: peptidylprolyl isomerase [Bryobacteraceae bacterium]|nr:peptidylprolyl isomerase [Bryobacteraceae bacterium]